MAMYELGESVVNRNNRKSGKIVDAVDSENGETEAVKLQYEDGSVEWMSTNSVSKMLLETDPISDNQFLSD
tara:strand:- start:4965 stop:5177 length:213 start_codon:yes stop_codon:yes gene_type:complete